MRIHTRLTRDEMEAALERGKAKGNIAQGTRLEMTEHRSYTHDRAFDVKMVSTEPSSPYAKRRTVNAYGVQYGQRGEYSGTWQEHGFFFAEMYDADPSATVYGMYADSVHFHDHTISLFEFDFLAEKTAADLEEGDYITGWNISGSAFGVVSGVVDNGKTVDVSIRLYGGRQGYRYTDTVTMRKDRPVLVGSNKEN